MKPLNILIIGSGGREHALADAIKRSPHCAKLFCAPGNAGIEDVATCLPIAVEAHAAILDACATHHIDFVVIGPEGPLVAGLADKLRAQNILTFGPSQAAAALEGSKGFMKDLCKKMGVRTAAYQRFKQADQARAYVRTQPMPIVIKADGLAAGKGVVIAQTIEEALAAITQAMEQKVFGASGAELVIEEFLVGEEVSFFALSDGNNAVAFGSAQDHKAAYDGDKGPNTGGMGAYAPAALITPAMTEQIMKTIIQPVVDGMRAAGCPFSGVLFAGLMMTATGPAVIEFNARFGDPETQVIFSRLKSDALQVLMAVAEGKLDRITLEWRNEAAVCVVMAAKGYPGDYRKGTVINGLDDAATVPYTQVLHAGTQRSPDGKLLAQGGRVLGVLGRGQTVAEAQNRAYQAVDRIKWPEGFCRRDIAWRAIKRGEAA